jgi:hypothetical protein
MHHFLWTGLKCQKLCLVKNEIVVQSHLILSHFSSHKKIPEPTPWGLEFALSLFSYCATVVLFVTIKRLQFSSIFFCYLCYVYLRKQSQPKGLSPMWHPSAKKSPGYNICRDPDK